MTPRPALHFFRAPMDGPFYLVCGHNDVKAGDPLVQVTGMAEDRPHADATMCADCTADYLRQEGRFSPR